MKIPPTIPLKGMGRFSFFEFFKKRSNSLVLKCFFLSFFMLSSLWINAQKVSVQYKDAPLKTVLTEISKQSKLRLAYSGSFVNLTSKVTVNAKNQELKVVLAEIEKQCPVVFDVKKDNIYISPIVKKEDKDSKAQKAPIKVTGTAYDDSNIPLIGVSILVKGSNKGTISDIDGNFDLEVNQNDVLVFNYIGFTQKEHKVTDGKPLNIIMSEDAKALDEVVVIGYGSVRKTDVTGSISSVKMDELSVTAPSLEQALIGHAAGVEIKQSSGSPGQGLSMRIRGVGSINAGGEPLYVIDGFPASKDVYINPSDVASIEVLKDAASAAIYGSRAAGGVVLITTKRGSNTGRAKVEYDFQYGFQEVSKKLDMLDAYGMRDLSIEAINNAYRDWCIKNGKEYSPLHNNEYRMEVAKGSANAFRIPDIFFDFTTNTPVEPTHNTDWQDAIFSTAPIMKHNLSVAGGNENIKYMASVGYLDQEGVIAPSRHQRITTRFNLDGKLTNRLSFGANTAVTHVKNKIVEAEGRHYNDGIIMSALLSFPQFPVYNADGSYAINEQFGYAGKYVVAPTENPVALAHNIKNDVTRNHSSVSGYLDLEIISGLKAKAYAGMQYVTQIQDFYRPANVGGTIMNGDGTTAGTGYAGDMRLARATYSTQTNIDWLLEGTLNYTKALGKHNINALGGYSMQKKTYDNSSIGARNFADDKRPELSAGGQAPGDSWGSTNKEAWSMMSVFGRLVYSWDDKYVFTGSLRTDASSRFGPNNRWGLFPSLALGWNLSNERFWIDNIGDDIGAKFRASWGLSGNYNIGNYGHVLYMSDGSAVLGNQIVPSRYPRGFVDENLGWEKTSQFNVGLDLNFLKNRLSASVNYYRSQSFDLLFQKQITAMTGRTTYWSNLSDSKVQNTGIDLQLDGRILTGAFTWSVGANISVNRNKVLALPDGQSITSIGERSAISHLTTVGKPVGSFYGLNSLGLISEADYQNILIDKQHVGEPGYVLTGPAVWNYESVQPGDAKWKDVNGDGKITEEDREILGDNYPDFTYGISTTFGYKDFSLSASFSGVQGVEVINFQNYYLLNMEGNGNQLAKAADRYNPITNPNAAMYRANIATTNKNTYGVSSYMINDASYFRCTNINLTYTVPRKIAQSLKLNGISLFASIDNAFTITGYSGYNPDVDYKSGNLMPGFDWGTYPLARAYNFGCKVSF